jgi:AraC-like DNA-binding protein
MNNLYIFSGSITSFFILLLLSKKNKHTSDKLLICWFTIVLFHIFVFYLSSIEHYEYLLEISSAAVFLSGPLLWLYTKHLIYQAKIKKADYLHFTPFLIHTFAVLPFIIEGRLAPMPGFIRELFSFAKIASIFVYCFLILKSIRKHHTVSQNFYSNYKSIHLKWLTFTVYSALFIAGIGLGSEVLFHFTNFNIPMIYEDIAVNITVSILIVVIGYYGFIQAPVFITTVNPNVEVVKYSKSGLNSDKSLLEVEKLEKVMACEKAYTDPDLSLDSLAEKLSISPNQLSQIINEQFNQTFFDYVNSYRVKEVENILKTTKVETTTLLGIAFDAGFNSKSSFNRYFKNKTGKTPTQYLKDLKQVHYA